jgi:hypothetical protein
MKYFAMTGERQTHRHTVLLIIELAIEAEKGESQDMAEESQDRLVKVRLRKRRASSLGTMVKRETTSKLMRVHVAR